MIFPMINLKHDDKLNDFYLEHDDTCILNDFSWTWWYTQWFTLNKMIYSMIFLEHDDILNDLHWTWWYTRW